MNRLTYRVRLWPYVAVSLLGALLWPTGVERPAHAQGTGDFKVIVNAANPLSTMSRNQTARLFLKKEERWSNGFAVTVVDLATDHPARKAFSREVLGKETSAVEAYWRKLIFSGMGSPPLKLATDTEVVTFVGKNVGSIGYVAGDTELFGPVKELEVTR